MSSASTDSCPKEEVCPPQPPPTTAPPRRKIFRRLKWWVLGTFATLFLLAIFAELAVNLWGYPAWVRRKIEDAIAPQGEGFCIIGWLKGGLFTGFEAEDILLDYNTPVGLVHAEISSLELQLSLSQLFALEARPTRMSVQNAKVVLYQNRNDALEVHSINGMLRLNTHNTLQGILNAHASGIQLRVNATLYNANRLLEPMKDSDLTPKEREALIARIRHYLEETQRELSQITFGTNDTFLQANIHGDILTPKGISIQGEYGIQDAIFHDIVVPKFRGQFQYHDQLIRLNSLQLFLSSSEVIQGTLEYHFRSSQLGVKANGDIFPSTILRLTDSSPSTIPEWLRFHSPISFEASLKHSGDDWHDLQPSLRFSCGDMEVAGLQIHKCKGNLSFRDQLLLLDNAEIELDSRRREILRGKASWNFASQELSAQLSGIANLPRFARELGISMLSPDVLDIQSNTEFEIALQPSPCDWKQWLLNGSIRQTQLQLNALPFLNTEVKFSLQDGEVTLSEVHSRIQFGNENDILVKAQAKCRLTDLLAANRRTAIDLHTWLALQLPEPEPTTSFLEVAGTAYTDLEKKTLSLANGHCALFPQTVCEQLARLLKLDSSYQLDWLHSIQPGTMDFTIPQFPVNNWNQFQVDGTAHFDECVFQAIPLQHLDANFVVTTKNFQMMHLVADAPKHNPQFSGSFKIDYEPFAIVFDNLNYKGDPLFIEPFLIDSETMKLFHEIWEPFTWSEDHLAQFQFNQLEFRSLPAQHSWLFNMQGTAETENFFYRQVKIPHAQCRVDLALPNGGVHVLDIVLDSQEPEDPTRLTGEAHFRFSNDILGRFSLHFHEGELDILNLLCNIAEPLKPILAPLELSHQTYFDVDGNFAFGNNSYLRLKGSVESPWVKFYSVEIQNLQSKWVATPQFIQWDCNNAEFFGGRLVATGEYNHGNGTGQCLLNFQDVPLEELIRVTSSKFHEHGASDEGDSKASNASYDKQPGLLDAEAKLAFYLNWAGQPIHMEGQGQISIHDANLWHVPLLTSLGKIISVGTFNFFSRNKIARLGTISRLKANVECQGNRIFIPDFKTDGTVVALAGSGEYDLRNNQMDFLVSGHFLKNLSIINWLLRPLSWAFKAELVGKPNDYEWHLRSGWRKLEDKDADD